MQISFLQLISHWLTGLGPRAAAVRWCMGMAAVWMLWIAHLGPVQAAGPLLLRDADNTVAAWPAVRLLVDEQLTLTAEEALARLDEFQKPTRDATLGVRKDAVWLHIPLAVDPASDGRWLLDINHPDLNRIDVMLLQGGKVLQRSVLGTEVPRAQRPLPGRTPAQAFQLEAGQNYEFLLRVQTRGAMILPITFNTPTGILGRAVNEQMLQGVLTGLALCLIFYTMAQWYSLREPMFIQYALLTSGSLLYSLHFFGVGQQYLWGHSPWLTSHAVGLASLMAITGSFLFMSQALEGHNPQSRFLRRMRLGALFTVGLGVAFALDLISLKGLAAIVSVINGALPVNFWTLHSFQISATLDMLLFMRVLGLRTKELHTKVQHANQQLDAMHSLAHTDPLTGLPNRRGMQIELSSALARATHENLLAVYVMDLDGFKPVNDQHGHDVGDELLVAVARRLQCHLRQSDVIARLGGDEFVVMTGELHSTAQAHELGLKLLEAFSSPFALGGIQVQVGLTIGYAIAPIDSQDGAGLIKLADAAMYSGKQSGKFCVRRNTGDLALSSA